MKFRVNWILFAIYKDLLSTHAIHSCCILSFLPSTDYELIERQLFWSVPVMLRYKHYKIFQQVITNGTDCISLRYSSFIPEKKSRITDGKNCTSQRSLMATTAIKTLRHAVRTISRKGKCITNTDSVIFQNLAVLSFKLPSLSDW